MEKTLEEEKTTKSEIMNEEELDQALQVGQEITTEEEESL